MGMLKEFKEFAIKGNVMDLAVAVIIGAAFGKIITALVEKILMPLIGSFGGANFSEMVMTVNGVDLATGAFIQAIIDFIIVAFCIFIMVKMINKAKGPEPEPEPEKTPEDVELLREIRDALKK